jgi:hypothetical protein
MTTARSSRHVQAASHLLATSVVKLDATVPGTQSEAWAWRVVLRQGAATEHAARPELDDRIDQPVRHHAAPVLRAVSSFDVVNQDGRRLIIQGT